MSDHEIIARVAQASVEPAEDWIARMVQRTRHNCAETLNALIEDGELAPESTLAETIHYLMYGGCKNCGRSLRHSINRGKWTCLNEKCSLAYMEQEPSDAQA